MKETVIETQRTIHKFTLYQAVAIYSNDLVGSDNNVFINRIIVMQCLLSTGFYLINYNVITAQRGSSDGDKELKSLLYTTMHNLKRFKTLCVHFYVSEVKINKNVIFSKAFKQFSLPSVGFYKIILSKKPTKLLYIFGIIGEVCLINIQNNNHQF